MIKSFDFISLHRRRQPRLIFHGVEDGPSTFYHHCLLLSTTAHGSPFYGKGKQHTHHTHTHLGLHTIMGFTELGHASRDGQWIYSWILPRTAFFYFGTGEAYYSTPRCTATCFSSMGAGGETNSLLESRRTILSHKPLVQGAGLYQIEGGIPC